MAWCWIGSKPLSEPMLTHSSPIPIYAALRGDELTKKPPPPCIPNLFGFHCMNRLQNKINSQSWDIPYPSNMQYLKVRQESICHILACLHAFLDLSWQITRSTGQMILMFTFILWIVQSGFIVTWKNLKRQWLKYCSYEGMAYITLQHIVPYELHF